MNEKTFRVAAAQMDCVLGDVKKNIEKMKEMVMEAAKNGAQVICFPELATTGYSPTMIGEKYYTISEEIPGPTTEFLGNVARENNIYIVTGISEKSSVPGVLYNSQVCIAPSGEVLKLYRKIHVWGLEKLYWKESIDCEAGYFNLPWCKAGMMICYDTSFPETARLLKLMGAEIIFDSAAWRIQEDDIWDLNTKARAVENHVFMVCANRCGVEGDSTLNGHSRIIGPRGNILAVAGRDEEIIYADINITLEYAEEEQFTYMQDRRPEAYGLLSTCKDF